MRVKWPVIAGTAALAALLLFQVSRRASPLIPEKAAAEPAAATVSTAAAERRDLPILLKASGRAEAKSSVSVKSRLDGQVAAILFTEGSPVRKGQVLLRMDPASADAQLRQAQALLARDNAQLERLANESQRNTALFDQGFISKNGLGQTQADLHAAQATQKADQANVDTARLQLGFTDVVSPVDGVAGAALLPVGGSAKANDTALVVVNQIRPIYVTFAIPESELSRLKSAQAQGAVAVTASVPGSTIALTGRLAFLDNAVDPSTGSIIVKASFANEGGELTPGQFAEVKVPVERLANTIVIPASAVESGVDGSFVFVVKPDSTVEIRRVKVLAEVDGFSAIGTGLQPGERVVTDGQTRLRGGSRVRIASPALAGRAP